MVIRAAEEERREIPAKSGPLQTAAAILFVGLAAAFAIWTLDRKLATEQQQIELARFKGFADPDEMKKAESAGFLDAASWRKKRDEDAAESAKKQAELQRQWEADAPKRAALAEETRKRELAEWEDRQPPDRRMSLIGQSWSTGGFDSIGLMSFTVKNDNPYPIKDFVISCRFHGNSGTFLGDREHKVYETVKAKSSRAFAKVNIGFIPSQSARGGCSLLSAIRI